MGLLRMFLHFQLTTVDWLTEEINLCQIDDFVAPATQNCFEGEERKSFHLRETYRRRHGEFLPMDMDLH